MLTEQVRSVVLVIGLTVLAGLGDSQGFVHAANVWVSGRIVWRELGYSALGFIVGNLAYWLSLKYLDRLGVRAPEIQTVFWFGVTILGVALTSGRFFHWRPVEQLVTLIVVVAIAWLLFQVK